MKTYLVGGAVRDLLLHYPHKEKDWVVVGSTPEEMIAHGFKPVGKDFPVFLHPQTRDEYALARTERKSGRGYTQFNFHASPDVTLEEDLKRRDLTINAIAQDDEGNIIDPYDGRADLKNKILRHVSPAFIEDPVRILRVARLMARFYHLGFTIAPETLVLMREMVGNGEVDALVAERVWQEWQRALQEKDPLQFLLVLNNCEALAVLLPELVSVASHRSVEHRRRGNPEIIFAELLLPLSEQDIKNICLRYKIPSDYKELALLAKKQQKILTEIKNSSAEQLLALFDATDAWRREERFQQLLSIFINTDQQEHLLRLLEKLKHISVEKFLQQGLQGEALGNALQQERLTLLMEELREHQTHR